MIGWLARFARSLAWTAAVAAAALCWLGVGFEIAVRSSRFPADDLASFSGSRRLLDRDGGLIREVVGRDGARAVWTPVDRIHPLLVQATIAVEDHRFFDHDGIDLTGIARSAVANLRRRAVVSGGSTITMQLARLVHPHPRTLGGKLGEMIEARRIERALSKDRIVEQYLNRAPYGAGAVGVEAASQRYFGKPNRHLSLAEAALLAGLPNSPSRLNPLRFPDAARRRQRHVLSRMRDAGMITADQLDQAVREPLTFRRSPPRAAALHFTDFVLAGGAPPGEVVTTLDPALQRELEGLARDHVAANAVNGMTNAAAIVLDNERCEIRAMVGSVDYWRPDAGAVNGATARRQPGSTLKPFTYALAFERGVSPVDVVADIETRYVESTGRQFSPKNFTDSYAGPVLARAALGRSLNVPAIRLADQLGPADLLARLRRAGFASLEQDAWFYGLGLALGNGEVTLLELASAYAMLARGGASCQPVAYRGQPAAPPRAVFDGRVSFLVTDILSDEALRIAAFGPHNALLLGAPVAVKTGTSSNWRDNWAIGYTDRFTVAIWTGDFDGRPMNQLGAAAGAGPLFHQVMKAVIRRSGERPASPRPPDGVVDVTVCSLSGQLPGPNCPHRHHARVLAPPTATCDWHRPIAIDVRNGLRAGPRCPARFVSHPVFEVLPPEYGGWQAGTAGSAAPPSEFSPLCPAEGPVPGALVIAQPTAADVYVIEPGYDRSTQTAELRVEAESGVERVTFRIDGRIVAIAPAPYRASWRLATGMHRLRVEAVGQAPAEIAFEVR